MKTAYRSLFTSAGLLTQEVIFGREYSKELSAFHETSWYYYSPTYSAKIAMTKKFMNTYLTTRGTPFTDIDGYQTIDFIREFDGRDARMAQTVISPTYKMKISGRERLYSPNWKVTRTGYHRSSGRSTTMPTTCCRRPRAGIRCRSSAMPRCC